MKVKTEVITFMKDGSNRNGIGAHTSLDSAIDTLQGSKQPLKYYASSRIPGLRVIIFKPEDEELFSIATVTEVDELEDLTIDLNILEVM